MKKIANKEMRKFLKTTIKMEETEYRKTIVKLIDEIYSCVLSSLEWNGKQRDIMTKVLTKRFKATDGEFEEILKVFKVLTGRLNVVSFCLYSLVVKSMRQHGEIASNDQRREIAKLLDVNIDDINDKIKSFQIEKFKREQKVRA